MILTSTINLFGQRKVRTPFSKDLDAFKKMTEYIIANNYHDNFRKYKVIDSDTKIDTMVQNFCKKYSVTIYVNYAKDSIIRYSRIFIPLLGKYKVLIFDFSSTCPTENSINKRDKEIILDKCIYYIEF